MAAGQAASSIYTMVVLQVFQAKMLQAMDERCPDPELFRKLRSATDRALIRLTQPEMRASEKKGCSSSSMFKILLRSTFIHRQDRLPAAVSSGSRMDPETAVRPKSRQYKYA